MFSSIRALSAICVTAFLLMGCSTRPIPELAPASSVIPPIEVSRAVVGDEFHFINRDGRKGIAKTVAVTGTHVTTHTTSKGSKTPCVWKVKRNALAPWVEWKNCGSSGSNTSKRIGSSAFPLAVGSTESWDYSGTSNTGSNWSSTRDCAVETAVKVNVPAGSFDALHIVCEDKWWVRESFVRADGVLLQFLRTRKSGPQDDNMFQRLEKFVPGDA